jgi:hypothetical protein
MAPYSWYEDLDAPASPPPTVSAVAVSSSQDGRGFTQGEESFTNSSSSFMRNVATSANALRHDYSLHARRIFSTTGINLHVLHSLTPPSRCLGDCSLSCTMHPTIQPIHSSLEQHSSARNSSTRAHCDDSLSVQATDTGLHRCFAGTAHQLQASHRHTSTLAHLFPAVTSSAFGIVFRVLVYFRFHIQAARGSFYTEARFHRCLCLIAMQNDIMI